MVAETEDSCVPEAGKKLFMDVVEKFILHFVPDGKVVFVGVQGGELSIFDEALLTEHGVKIDITAKLPDVVLYCSERKWFFIIDLVTGQGIINKVRHSELANLFAGSKAGLVYVTAFPNRSVMGRYLSDIAWETEVWVADAPSHLIHFNGSRFLGPYDEQTRE